ncbi:aconitase X catalytic domain-containing protein [Rhodococcus opacus]|uniref:aconitase X catalytic domain-containing protein n=1 Tax=Rhodococcus opacus TaxID=37919 RepID=UPI00294997AB|nr:aconitase X catalytic domain-containing protein [Rhodococcus opacus]MDV6247077.1 aconitase X catalytic domain-containing protein [Rhodococcus opacus]
MKLSDHDKRMLDGEEGPAVQEAMEFLVKFGEGFEADEMVDVHSAHLFADTHTVGRAAEIYTRMAELGGKVRVPTTTEPISFDPEYPDDFKLPEDYPERQRLLMAALRQMDAILAHSNTIYLTQNIPKIGENLAWIESSAAGWANSVIGARANREGAITCLMAALTGRIPKHGLLDERNRKGQILIEIDPGVIDQLGGRGTWLADYHALGFAIGSLAYDRIPVITGLPSHLTNEQLKAICSICSPVYTGALLLMVGISPEAPTVEAAFGGTIPKDVETHRVGMQDVKDAYEKIRSSYAKEITGVLSGCPFKSINELQEVAELLDGKQVRDDVWVWITTDPSTRELARNSGIAQRIEASGAKLYAGTCHFMQPVAASMGPEHVIATDSMKMPLLLAGPGKPQWLYGTLKDCIAAATTGKFIETRWT